jgi:hypothetical protein
VEVKNNKVLEKNHELQPKQPLQPLQPQAEVEVEGQTYDQDQPLVEMEMQADDMLGSIQNNKNQVE